jgi:hypothetical protein
MVKAETGKDEKGKPTPSLLSEEQAKKLAADVTDPKPKKKSETRGRKKKVTLDPELSVTKDMCEFVFNVIADRSGEHWRLNSDESKQLAVCADKLTEKYAELLMKYQLELFSGFTLLMIVYPRFKQDRENAKTRKTPSKPEKSD